MTKRARRLRANMTDAEGKLWKALRRNQLNNLNFRRQHPVGSFTLDFYCPSIRLGIEIDGGQHALENKRMADNQRTRWLSERDICVIRFWNNDVLGNLSGVLEEIARIAADRSAQVLTPPPTPPPSGGGRGGTSP